MTVGNLAAMMQGADVATTDVDVAAKRSAGNRARLMSALGELETRYRMFDGSAGSLVDTDRPGMFLGSEMWGFITKYGPLDVLLVPEESDRWPLSYEYLRRDAALIHLGGGWAVLAASLSDIVRLKETADRPKDRAVLPELRRARDEQVGLGRRGEE